MRGCTSLRPAAAPADGRVRSGPVFFSGTNFTPAVQRSTARHDCADEDCNRCEKRCEKKPKRIADPVCVLTHGRSPVNAQGWCACACRAKTDCSCNRFPSFLCSVLELAAYGRFWRPPPSASPRSHAAHRAACKTVDNGREPARRLLWPERRGRRRAGASRGAGVLRRASR